MGYISSITLEDAQELSAVSRSPVFLFDSEMYWHCRRLSRTGLVNLGRPVFHTADKIYQRVTLTDAGRQLLESTNILLGGER